MNTNSRAENQKEESFRSKFDDKLFNTRSILIYGEINQKLAREISEKLIVLAAESNDDINLYINSQGGHVEAGDTIHDMIQFVKPKVKIIGTGWVASAGALIYIAVPKDQRYSLPNTRFMLHQPSGGVGGQASDISIEAQEILKMRQRINQIISRQTGQTIEKVEKDTDRNFWMSAEEAKSYGLVGHVIKAYSEL
jgi:ATP-dependent Clp protease protease subunit